MASLSMTNFLVSALSTGGHAVAESNTQFGPHLYFQPRRDYTAAPRHPIDFRAVPWPDSRSGIILLASINASNFYGLLIVRLFCNWSSGEHRHQWVSFQSFKAETICIHPSIPTFVCWHVLFFSLEPKCVEANQAGKKAQKTHMQEEQRWGIWSHREEHITKDW